MVSVEIEEYGQGERVKVGQTRKIGEDEKADKVLESEREKMGTIVLYLKIRGFCKIISHVLLSPNPRSTAQILPLKSCLRCNLRGHTRNTLPIYTVSYTHLTLPTIYSV